MAIAKTSRSNRTHETELPSARDRLLDLFDKDPQIASAKLADLRKRLILFFSAARCLDPQELAQKTIVRLFDDLINEKIEVTTTIEGLVFGYARNILHESHRSIAHKEVPLESIMSSNEPRTDPLPELLIAFEQNENLLDCFRGCLAMLQTSDRELILAYYDRSNAEKLKKGRERMALALGVTRAQLRRRAFKIRMRLKDCIEDCLELKDTI